MIDRFFIWVWRLNGLVVLVAALIILGMMSVEFFEKLSNTEQESIVTDIAEDPNGKEKWVLGRPRGIEGLEVTIVPLVSENKEAEKEVFYMYSSDRYRGGSEEYSKNILFINRETNEMRWLFEGVGQIINTVGELPNEYNGLHDEKGPTEIIIYSINMKDTDGDGVITNSDSPALAFSLPDGSDFQVLLEGYEKLISTTLEKNKTLSVMYQMSGSAYLARFSLNPVVKMSNTAFPKLGQ